MHLREIMNVIADLARALTLVKDEINVPIALSAFRDNNKTLQTATELYRGWVCTISCIICRHQVLQVISRPWLHGGGGFTVN